MREHCFISLPPKPYSAVKPTCIRQQIAGKSFSNREYIDDLVRLEDYILERVHSYASALRYRRLRNSHPDEWEKIYSELDPKGFKRVLRLEREQKAKWESLQEVRKREISLAEARAKQDWAALGGVE
jgi:hypothetical protein